MITQEKKKERIRVFDIRAKFDETFDKIPERETFKTISIIKQSILEVLSMIFEQAIAIRI